VSARLERPDAIASAVTDVLAKPSYRDNARRLADATSKTDPLRTLDEILIDVSARQATIDWEGCVHAIRRVTPAYRQ
jgi:UDP:flavonoid glycosyltransferase YjiC (YdhE family)